jgi:hypothetical protein
VRVFVHPTDLVPAGNIRDLREKLVERFGKVAERFGPDGLDLDQGSMSVMGQTIEGTIPLARLEAIRAKLRDHGLQMEPLLRYQVAESAAG